MAGHASFVLLVVLVVGGDDPRATEAASRAARAALPPSSSVEVRRVSSSSDDGALGVERSTKADGVAIVSFDDRSPKRVRVRVHRREDDVWLDREIAFEGSDKVEERGRTVGFAIASMFPEAKAEPDNNPRGGTAAPSGAPAPAPSSPSSPSSSPATPAPPASSSPVVRDAASTPRSTPLRGVIDAVAIAAVGVAGYGGGLGGRAGGGFVVAPRVTLRLDASFRRAEVPPAQATSLVLTGGPGIAFDVVASDGEQPFGVGLRVSGLAIFHSHSHLSDEPESVTESRWLPGASAGLEGSLRLSDAAAVLVGGGTEVAFGQTDVFLNGRRVAVVPPVRMMADLGVRVRF